MIKFKILNQSIDKVPSCGFSFRDPDTGKEFRGTNYKTFEELESHVQNYREQNGLPKIEEFRKVWEHYVCMNYSSERKNCCPQDDSVSRNFKQYIAGGLAYIKSVMQKEEDKFVDEEEANRRAKLCLNCKNNIKNYGHSFAHYYTDKVMARSVGDRRVRDWQNLFTCKCCSCILNSKVWFSGKIVGGSLLRRDLEELKQSKDYAGKPFKCWQVEAWEALQEAKKKGDK